MALPILDETAPAAGRDAALVFSHVTVRHAGRPVLEDVTFEVPRGSTVAVTGPDGPGPDGPGPSAVIEASLGLCCADGVIRVLGLDPAAAVASGRLGALLASSGLPGGARVGDLLVFLAAAHPAPLAVEDVLARTGIAGLRDRTTGRLSPSEAQLVRLAIAITGDPDLLLLDEPFADLDPEARDILRCNLDRFRDEGRTVVFTTTLPDLVPPAVDHVLVVEHGEIRDRRGPGRQGTPCPGPGGQGRGPAPLRASP